MDHSYEREFPQVILVGGKESGKTSIIGAICGVHIGTNTTCPVEWTIRASETWGAEVAVAYRYPAVFSNTFRLSKCKLLNSGRICSTPSELWLLIRKAEILALGPRQDISSVLAMDEDSVNQAYLDFLLNPSSPSTGVILVDIRGPGFDVHALTIVDLPGLSRLGHPMYMDYVKKVIRYYVTRRTSVIAAVASVTQPKVYAQGLSFLKTVSKLDWASVMLVLTYEEYGALDPIWLNILNTQGHRRAQRIFLCLIPQRDPPFADHDIQGLRQEEAMFFQFCESWVGQVSLKKSLGIRNIIQSWQEIAEVQRELEMSLPRQKPWKLLLVLLFIMITFLAIVTNGK